MNSVVFDRSSYGITGIDREPMAFEGAIYLPYDVELAKDITVNTGEQRQKVDAEGRPLYLKQIPNPEYPKFEEVSREERVPTGETEVVVMEDGSEVDVPVYEIVITTELVEVDVPEFLDEETIESRIPVKFEEQSFTYRVAASTTTETHTNEFGEEVTEEVPVYEEVTTTSKVPIEFIELAPIMEDVYASERVTLRERYFEFNDEEVVAAKAEAINKAKAPLSLAVYSEEMEPAEFTSLSGVHMGAWFIALEPGGSATTVEHVLPSPASTVELYMEAQPGVEVAINGVSVPAAGGTVEFDGPVEAVTLTFTNTAASRREVYAYGVVA